MDFKSDGQDDRGTAAKSLFRNQALDARSLRYGAPVAAPGIGLALTTAFCFALVAATILFVSRASFPRKVTVSGSLVPSAGLLAIASHRPGVITNVYVQEGGFVKQGDPIVRISFDSVLPGGEQSVLALAHVSKDQAIATRQNERAAEAGLLSQVAGARARIEGLDRQMAALSASADLAAAQASLAQQTVDDSQRLVGLQMLSRLQYRQVQAQALSARQSLGDIRVRIADLKAQKSGLQQELGQFAAQRQQNRANGATARLNVLEKTINYEASGGQELVAQRAGRVTLLQAKAGEIAAPGRTIAAVMPQGSVLFAELWVPSSAIGFVRKGTEVQLMYEAFPYQSFGVAHAKVVGVANSPTAPEELPVELQSRESRYRILAVLDQQRIRAYQRTFDLTPGMRLRADLILERRSPLRWLLDPVLALKRRSD